MNVKDYDVRVVDRSEVKDFIEENHYSKSINGLKVSYSFGLYRSDELIGAMIYGELATTAWKKYGDSERDVLELRRLVLVDDTPKNSESYFIGKTLRWLKRYTSARVVVSYADPNYGHSGVIYRASNFSHEGMTAKGKVIFWQGKKYHDRAMRTKYKGELKPFARRLAEAVEKGEAVFSEQEPKHIYLYRLRRKVANE